MTKFFPRGNIRYCVYGDHKRPMPDVLRVMLPGNESAAVESYSVCREPGETDGSLMRRAQDLAHYHFWRVAFSRLLYIQMDYSSEPDPVRLAAEDQFENQRMSLRFTIQSDKRATGMDLVNAATALIALHETKPERMN